MYFNHEELTSILFHGGMQTHVCRKACHELRNNLRMIVDLQGNNPLILAWGIGHHIGKIAIQRHDECFQFLGLRQHDLIGRVGREGIPKPHDFNANRTQRLNNGIGDTVIRKASETYHTATSNSVKTCA